MDSRLRGNDGWSGRAAIFRGMTVAGLLSKWANSQMPTPVSPRTGEGIRGFAAEGAEDAEEERESEKKKEGRRREGVLGWFAGVQGNRILLSEHQ